MAIVISRNKKLATPLIKVMPI